MNVWSLDGYARPVPLWRKWKSSDPCYVFECLDGFWPGLGVGFVRRRLVFRRFSFHEPVWCYSVVVDTRNGFLQRVSDGSWNSWERLWNAGYGFRMVPNSWELVSTRT